MYPLGPGGYDQSDFWLKNALNRDAVDAGLLESLLASSSLFRNRGTMPQGANVDTLALDGFWSIPNSTVANSLVGTLPTKFPGTFINFTGTSIVKAQIFMPYGPQAGMWWRVGRGEGTWEPWVNPNDNTSGFYKGTLPSGTDIDTAELNGAFGMPNQTSADSMGGTWPTRYPGVFISVAATVWVRAQIFIPYSAQAAFWWRAGLGTGTYTPWQRAVSEGEAGGGGPDSGLANSVLQDEFYSRFGGPIGTGGLGAVAIRFDHGLNNFNQHIRPMLESRNLKYCLALASQRWTQAENTAVTAAMVNTWVRGGLAEIWNHGRTAHNNASGYDANYTYWVAGLEELRAQLPDAFISGVILPGTGTSGQFDGLGGAGNAKQIYSSIGGQVILAHHAVVSGAFPGTELRPLDGRLQQGQYHFGMESRTSTEIIAKIQEAQAQKKGLQLMMHPSLIGEPGNISVAGFEQVMSYIATERTAGRLAVLSPYELLIADRERSRG